MFLLLMAIVSSAAAMNQSDPAAHQLEIFLERHPSPVGIMTTSAGEPYSYSEVTSTLNKRLLLNKYYSIALFHITRERIPERVVHAKGAGAFGYFEVTHNISHICKASLFSKIGKKTPVAVRFSPLITERGGSDMIRDNRGFAVKFYTEEGNLDIVGLNQPVFGIKDPILFPSLVHALKKNPATNLYDFNAFWDFMTLNPESLNSFLRIFGDSGIPNGYSNMPGFSIHTYLLENVSGDISYARFHFIPQGGIKTLTSKEAMKIGVVDPDYNTRNLYNSIENGNFPSWTVALQIVTDDQIKRFGLDNITDVTKTLSLSEYPLTKVGKFILNTNTLNYHAEIEQLAFNPANLVPGVRKPLDNIFNARYFIYNDALDNRLGPNFNRIKVNCPLNDIFVYSRDGSPPVGYNQKNFPNYRPNSFNGPVPLPLHYIKPLPTLVENKPNNFDQVTDLYANEMTNDQKGRLVENILQSLRLAASFIQERAVTLFTKIHPDLGNRVQQGLIANKNMTTHEDTSRKNCSCNTKK